MLWEMDSKELGFTNEQITQKEDISLGELMRDAHESQQTLREMLASARSWTRSAGGEALQAMNLGAQPVKEGSPGGEAEQGAQKGQS